MPKTKAVARTHKPKRKQSAKRKTSLVWKHPSDVKPVNKPIFAPQVSLETSDEALDVHEAKAESSESRQRIKTIFDVGAVDDPLIGSPKDVQKHLDALALYLQKFPDDDDAFVKIHSYMHKYLLGLVFRKYTWVPGCDANDLYQESLIALSKKAIPNFNPTKGMSFLNFAKMCVNRHIITILNAAKNRKKDLPMNQAISLDHSPIDGDDDGNDCILANIISDNKTTNLPCGEMAKRESFRKSLEAIKSKLSKFESLVLDQYLQDLSYKEIAKNLTKMTGIRYNEKSVDNSLLRIRKKSVELLRECGSDIQLYFDS